MSHKLTNTWPFYPIDISLESSACELSNGTQNGIKLELGIEMRYDFSEMVSNFGDFLRFSPKKKKREGTFLNAGAWQLICFGTCRQTSFPPNITHKILFVHWNTIYRSNHARANPCAISGQFRLSQPQLFISSYPRFQLGRRYAYAPFSYNLRTARFFRRCIPFVERGIPSYHVLLFFFN